MKRTQLSLALLVLAGLTLAVQGCGGVKKPKASTGGGEAAANGTESTADTNKGIQSQEKELAYSCEVEAAQLGLYLDDKRGDLFMQRPEFIEGEYQAEDSSEMTMQYVVFEPVADNADLVGAWKLSRGLALVAKKPVEIMLGQIEAANKAGNEGEEMKDVQIEFVRTDDKGGYTFVTRSQFKKPDDSEFRACEVQAEATIKESTPQEGQKKAFIMDVKAAKKEFKVKVPVKPAAK